MPRVLPKSKTSIITPDTLPSNAFQILSICSGKGGVGKTMTTVNLSVVLAKAGWRITILDGDLGLASIKLMLPLFPKAHLGQWLAGKCQFMKLVTSSDYGFKIISAPPMEFQLHELTNIQQTRLASLFNMIENTSDLLIIDNGAGISKNVMGWSHMSNRLLLVTTPDPTAMMSAYATIKAYTTRLIPSSIGIIVNQVRNIDEAFDTYKRLNEAIIKYLGIDANWLGYFTNCRDFRQAIKDRVPPVTLRPNSTFSRNVRKTTAHVSRWLLDENVPMFQEKSYIRIKKALSELELMDPVVQ